MFALRCACAVLRRFNAANHFSHPRTVMLAQFILRGVRVAIPLALSLTTGDARHWQSGIRGLGEAPSWPPGDRSPFANARFGNHSLSLSTVNQAEGRAPRGAVRVDARLIDDHKVP